MKQFFQHFIPGGSESLNAGQEFMCSLAGTSVETDQAEVRNARPFYQDGTLSLLVARVTANTLSGTFTVKTALGADGSTPGNCSVVFSAAQTGIVEDDSNTDDVAAAALYSFMPAAASGTGSVTFDLFGMVWEPDSGSITLLGCNGASSTGVAANGTNYLQAHGTRQSTTTEIQCTNIVSMAGTWRYLGIGSSTINLTNVDVVFTSRINSADGNQVVVFNETHDNNFIADESNTDTVAVGDLINLEIVTSNSSNDGGTNFEWSSSQIASASDETVLMTGGLREIVANAATVFFAAAGQVNSAATEADAEHGIRMDAVASNLGAYCSQSGGGDMTLTLRISGGDGNQTVSITTVPGGAVDESNTDDILETDTIAIEAFVPASPSGNCRLQSTSLVLTAAAAGPDHDLTPNDLTGGTPTLDSPALSQLHSLTPTDVATGAPAIDSPALTQVHALSPADVATGAPAIDSPALDPGAPDHELTPTDLATGAPAVDSPGLSQLHALTASEILVAAPTIDSPALTQIHALTPVGLTTGAPILDSPGLTDGGAAVAALRRFSVRMGFGLRLGF